MAVRSVGSSSRKQESKPVEKKSEPAQPRRTEAPAERRAPKPFSADRFEARSTQPTRVALSAPARRTDMDPRVAARLKVEPSPVQGNGQGQLAVSSVAFQPPGHGPGQSQGRHNVYVRLEGPDGKPLPRDQVEKYFTVEFVPAAGNPTQAAAGKFGDPFGVGQGEWKPGGAGGPPTDAYFSVDLYSSSAAEVWIKPNPNIPDNPYAGYGSQKVGPFTMQMGNPAEGTHGEHVNYLVTFRVEPGSASQAPEPTAPAAPAQPPATPAQPVEAPVETPVAAPAVPPSGTGSQYAPGTSLKVTANVLNVRGSPSLEGQVNLQVRNGEQLTVTAPPDGSPPVQGDWVHVRTPTGNTGWVHSDWVQPASAAPARPAQPSQPVQAQVPMPAGAPGSPFGVPYEVVPGMSVNGRMGVHWPTNFNPGNADDMAQVGAIIGKMKELGAGYTTLNVPPDQVGAMKPVFDALNAAGISPVVRLYQPGSPDTWSDADIQKMANGAVELGRAGVHFVQIGNEPNIETSLDGSGQDKEAKLQASVSRLAETLVQVHRGLAAAGQADTVQVGLAPMAAGAGDHAARAWSPETYYKALLHEVRRRETDPANPSGRLVDWIATHPYVYEDGANTGMTPGSGGARGMMGWGPDSARWYEGWAAEILGYAPRSLATEGGAVPDSFRHGNQERVAREMQTTLDQLRGNSNATTCLWLEWESAPHSDNWDRSVLDPRDGGDAAWSQALPILREAARAG